MRLGWLSRLGIVLTAFGLPVLASYYAIPDIRSARHHNDELRYTCLQVAKQEPGGPFDPPQEKCWDEWKKGIDASFYWRNGFGVGAIPLAIAWMLALAAYWSVRWIMAGRAKPPVAPANGQAKS